MGDSFGVGWPSGAWLIAGLVIASAVVFVLSSFVGALSVSVFLYYAIRPVYRWLDGRIDHPDVTASITILVVGLPMLVVVAYGGFVGLREADQFLRQADLDRYRSLLVPYVDAVALPSGSNAVGRFRDYIPRLVGAVTTLFDVAVRLFVIVVVTFYLLRDDHKISTWFRSTFDGEHGVVAFFEGVDDDLDTIYTGNLVTVGITGVIAVATYYGLNLLAPPGTGIAFPVLLGLLTGIATLIPAVGMKLIYVPYTGYLVWGSAVGQGVPIWFPIAFFVVTFLAVDTFPDIFVRSYVSSGGINMGLMILTYVLAAISFGWYGVFLGPIVLVLFLHFLRGVLPNLLDTRTGQFVTENR